VPQLQNKLKINSLDILEVGMLAHIAQDANMAIIILNQMKAQGIGQLILFASNRNGETKNEYNQKWYE